MWKIAVADTAEDHLTLLKDALKAYSQETHRVFSVTSYTDLTVLEKDMAQGEHFDLLILDLVMNGQGALKQSGGSGKKRMAPLLYFSLQTGNTLWKVMK